MSPDETESGFDVGEADFETRVIERSGEVPVIVDFWAEWCGPCRTLTPALEKAVEERNGEVELAKVDVDANQSLAATYGVRGIPAVKAFRDGSVVDEFTGAVPPAQINRFLDRLTIVPRARELIQRGEADEALELLDRLEGDFEAEGLAARVRLEAAAATNGSDADGKLARAFAAWDEGDHETVLEILQEAIAEVGDDETRDLLRKVMVGIFTELGADHPLSREHRRRLAAALT